MQDKRQRSIFTIKKLLLVTLVLFFSACNVEEKKSVNNAAIEKIVAEAMVQTEAISPLSAPRLIQANMAFSLSGLRSVAAQCFQCHGTDGNSKTGIPSLNGLSDDTLIQLITARKTNNNANDLMHKQAGAYTNAEIAVIASYISTLPKEMGE
ncbi:MAG: c-type cytochrome [Cocleimonas sp.]|nr:c-type cytochrome [Cocleimonas sp.]